MIDWLKKRPLIAGLIVLNLVLALGLIGNNLQKKINSEKRWRESVETTAKSFDEDKYMKKDDYVKQSIIGRQMHETGRISDPDLTYFLGLLDSNPDPKNPNGKLATQLTIYNRLLLDIREFTPQQKEMLYNYSVKSLQGKSGTMGNEYIIAIGLMEKTRDRRILPYVLPFTQSKNKDLHDEAMHALTVLGTSSAQK